MKVKSESEVAQSCTTLRDPMDCSLPGSSVHGIFQAGVLEWGAIEKTIKTNVFIRICNLQSLFTYLSVGNLSVSGRRSLTQTGLKEVQ